MTPAETAVIVAAGLLGGTLNTMAAGGGVLTFLALIVTGVPPQAAIATSQMAIPASFLAGAPRAWRSRAEYRPIAAGIAAAGIGAALGVWLVTLLDAETFRQITPLLMMVAAVLLLLQPHMPRLIDQRQATTGRRRQAAVAVALFGTSLYAGAFGGGVAVAILLVFACLTPWPWHQSNATKNVVCLVMSLIGSAAFAVTGLARWDLVAWLAGSQLLGGIAGTWLAKRLPADMLRNVVAVVTVFGAGIMANP